MYETYENDIKRKDVRKLLELLSKFDLVNNNIGVYIYRDVEDDEINGVRIHLLNGSISIRYFFDKSDEFIWVKFLVGNRKIKIERESNVSFDEILDKTSKLINKYQEMIHLLNEYDE